jgi:hypothetical protein
LKKIFLYILIVLLIPLILIGCRVKLGSYTINNLTVTRSKPTNYYYTNSLAKNLTLETEFKVKLLDTNFYKEKDLSKEDVDTIKNFAKSLKKSNFIDKPKELPDKPLYKIFLTFSKDKYVINVYNEKYIAVYPWDGSYTMDYVDMDGIQTLYNLFGLCKYLIPR